jgi:hypothetical protein
MLLTLEEESVKEKFSVSSIDHPRHILSSSLNEERQICYYTQHMKSSIVEYWNGKTKLGHLPVATHL